MLARFSPPHPAPLGPVRRRPARRVPRPVHADPPLRAPLIFSPLGVTLALSQGNPAGLPSPDNVLFPFWFLEILESWVMESRCRYTESRVCLAPSLQWRGPMSANRSHTVKDIRDIAQGLGISEAEVRAQMQREDQPAPETQEQDEYAHALAASAAMYEEEQMARALAASRLEPRPGPAAEGFPAANRGDPAKALMDSALVEIEAACASLEHLPAGSEWLQMNGLSLEPALCVVPSLGFSAVQLIDARWFVQFASNHSRMPRRQEIHQRFPAACVKFPDFRKMSQVRNNGLRILVISHPWLQPDHPDPRGDNMKLIAKAVAAFLREYEREPFGDRDATFGIFLDFMSLMQKDERGERTVEDRVHPSPPERCPQGSGAVLLKIEQSQLRLCALLS